MIILTVMVLFACLNAEELSLPIETEIVEDLNNTLWPSATKQSTNAFFATEQIGQINIPIVITNPGTYLLSEDISIQSRTQPIPIIIDSDDVILDLNNFSISNSFSGIGTAIFVRPNHSNVRIGNGKITGMNVSGIFISPGTQRVLIENIGSLGNNIGFNFAGTLNLIVRDCTAYNSRLQGFFFANTSATGIGNQNIIIQECVSNNNADSGFVFNSCINGFFVNLVANNNRGNGMIQTLNSGCVNITYQECFAAGNRLNGFFLAGTSCSLITCESQGNGVIGTQVVGNFFVITNCESLSNITGYDISGRGICLLNCVAKNNSGDGFFLTPTSFACQIRDNTATLNGVGFRNAGTNNRIYGNYANDNTTANYIGVPNTFLSPTVLSPINHTANIEN